MSTPSFSFSENTRRLSPLHAALYNVGGFIISGDFNAPMIAAGTREIRRKTGVVFLLGPNMNTTPFDPRDLCVFFSSSKLLPAPTVGPSLPLFPSLSPATVFTPSADERHSAVV